MINNENFADRQKWMQVLACSSWQDLREVAAGADLPQAYKVLRKPETGLVMVRGRMGGTGQPFNTGEATVTRCSVRCDQGTTGHAYVMGRNADHALLAARLDCVLQDESRHEEIYHAVITPLMAKSEAQKAKLRRKVAATKVDFFTMVRGEDDT